MDESEKIRQRCELLKMARDLLVEDYINKRAMEHNKWVEENNEMWKNYRRRLPYPTFTPYPTEQDIVNAAEKMYAFAFEGSVSQPVEDVTEEIKPAIVDTEENTHEDTRGENPRVSLLKKLFSRS